MNNIDPFSEENWDEVDTKCFHKLVMKYRIINMPSGETPEFYTVCLWCGEKGKI